MGTAAAREKLRRQVSPADISIVVPVGGAAPAWGRAARSLARLDPPPAEIIVVIDGPDDSLVRQAARTGGTVLVLEERGGPARARNRGAREARGEILFFLDSDVEAPPGLLSRLADLVNEHPATTAFIGSYDDRPGDPAFLSQYRNLLHHHVHQTGREAASTFWSGCGALPRRVFRDLGGFDEDYPVPSIEDIELGARLRRAGHGIRLEKSLQVKHLKRWRLFDMLRTDLLRRAVPWTELMLREGEMVNDLNVKTRDRLSVTLAFLLLIALPTGLLWWPSWAAGIGAGTVLMALNSAFFRFLLKSRGILFSLAAVPLYWIYLLICGAGFGLGATRHLLASARPDGSRVVE